MRAAAAAITTSFETGGKLLAFGNGGSAAEAQHLAADLVGRFKFDRPALPAIAICADPAVLTAVANDYGLDRVFARQVEAFGRSGDVIYAISTSGTSHNIIAAVQAAANAGLRTICSVGERNSALARAVEVPIVINGTGTPDIQERQLTVVHALSELVEHVLFGETPTWRPAQRAYVRAADKVLDWPRLVALRKRWKAHGTKVVWTNGCFDLLHVGHLRSLEAARALGDVLVVGVNGDASVQQLKGPHRPIQPARERSELVAAIEAVDHVIVFDELTPSEAIARLRPDVHAKGGDYDAEMPERPVVESYGGTVRLLPMIPGRSTSSLAEAAGRAQQARAPRRAAFLDRDGTVIVDVGYLSDAEQIQLMPGVIEALHGLRQRGFLLVMVSNQSGVGRGSITPERARAAHQHLVSVLAGHDIVLDDARYCLHAPSDNCDCRKPSPGLILKAARDLGINLSESVLVGDKETDIRAGDAAGIGVTILLGGTGTDKRAASDWHEALRRIDELTASAA